VDKLDYTTPRDYAYGVDTPVNHITTNHILPSPGKSQYIFQSNTSTIPERQAGGPEHRLRISGSPRSNEAVLAHLRIKPTRRVPQVRRLKPGSWVCLPPSLESPETIHPAGGAETDHGDEFRVPDPLDFKGPGLELASCKVRVSMRKIVLSKLTGMTGGPYCYVYDGNGLRVAKKSGANSDCSGGTVVKLYWRSISGDALAETDGTGSVSNAAYNEYVFFAGRRVASRNGSGGIFYWFADQLGSTRTITTGSGTGQTPGQLCYDADFTPYGQEISHTERLQTTACTPSYKFTGYERDPETAYGQGDTGVDYAFARYYSSRLGRFLSTDPLGGSIGNLQSDNAYTYVLNNPTDYIDPLGLYCSLDQIARGCRQGAGWVGGSFAFIDVPVYGWGFQTYTGTDGEYLGTDWSYGLLGYGLGLGFDPFLPFPSGPGGGDQKSNPCNSAKTIGIPIQLQLAQAQANGGIAVSSVTFSEAGPVNGVTLSTFSKFSAGGVSVPAFTTVTVLYNGSVLSIGATSPVSLATGTSLYTASADLLEFSNGKVTKVDGSVDLLGLIPVPNGSQSIQNNLNSNGGALNALGGLSARLGKCANSK
jgi:RHS repeat-associated protein